MRPYRKKRELANWVRRRLGAPVLDVLIDSTQIDDCIDQACDYFGEHAGGIGNEQAILLISPELVYYDGTGNVNQPGPTRGKWRRPYQYLLDGLTPEKINNMTLEELNYLGINTTTPSSTACCPTPTNSTANRYGGVDGNPATTINLTGCDIEVKGPGTDWCGIGPQGAHCFTETDPGDPEATGPYWVEGDTTGKPSQNGYVFKTIYDVPSDVIAVHDRLTTGIFGNFGNTEDNALFSPAGMLLQGGGSWGMMNSGTYTDSRWGYWMGANGGFVDIVSWQLSMQYIEMFRQMFTVKVDAQLLEMQHKVRLTPPPTSRGVIALECTRKVADEYLYEHQAVRDLAYAHAMIQVGMNASKFTGLSMPGGGAINGELYLSRGDALREKIEKQIADGFYSMPPDLFVG